MSNFLSYFKDVDIVKIELKKIFSLSEMIKKKIYFMEVCGTHTMQISKYGIRKILPQNIKLISGPGCPVCVTPLEFIDKAIYILDNFENVTILTFGDLYRVVGSKSSLEKEKSKGKDIRILYSPDEILSLAKENPDRNIVFLSIGFETTLPSIGCVIKEAKVQNIKNIFFLMGNKFFLPALEVLILLSRNFISSNFNADSTIDGFILPGHLSTIIGERSYHWIAQKYKIPSVITGFEPVDILQGIRLLVEMIVSKNPGVKNQYSRVVSYDGNLYAKEIIKEVFDITEGKWRGMGLIPATAAKLKKEFEDFDAEKRFNIPNFNNEENLFGCRCNEVLIGKITPIECPLFDKVCNPENPKGACMVSTEGACAAYYKYERI
ncbi:MAG: hydrogenase formation protein HypD [Elusimicrobiota bacterium]|nr:hydrogenase formation protein HypD [Endomicrobiia bacterium]MDW8165289.1 hydrogenase formation protein HypD [Elusimicrobiota bacterium]